MFKYSVLIKFSISEESHNPVRTIQDAKGFLEGLSLETAFEENPEAKLMDFNYCWDKAEKIAFDEGMHIFRIPAIATISEDVEIEELCNIYYVDTSGMLFSQYAWDIDFIEIEKAQPLTDKG